MTQAEALEVLKTGANVFLTGEPGAGKTHTLNTYITYLREHSIDVAVTASTGIAATHIGGMTIHAWSGIGIKDSLSPYDLEQIATRERLVKRIMQAKVLVIDEISMLDARVFGMVDQVLRVVRRCREPFGGVQVVLVGDFFQLLPIGRRGEKRILGASQEVVGSSDRRGGTVIQPEQHRYGEQGREEIQFAFAAPLWHELALMTCYLHEQFRQSDSSLAGLLAMLRSGTVDESAYDILESCKDTSFADGIEPTRLYTHNVDVDRINSERLEKLDGTKSVFAMESRGARPLIEGLKKSCLSPENLELKVGAMVICTKNNFDVGYVNGTLGQIVKYEEKTGYPVIETLDGDELVISPASWSVTEGDVVLAEVTQVPLRLAWAITVHKSQGMSLDAAEIDLSNAFEYGQGYVALSRVRSLQGLLLRGCNQRALEVHPNVRMHDQDFKEQSDTVRTAFNEMSSSEKQKMHEQFIKSNGGTLERVALEKRPARGVDKTSTYEKTRLLLCAGQTIAEIARARSMMAGTIASHLEYLALEGTIRVHEVAHLRPDTQSAKKQYDAVIAAIAVVGDEKLKPIYEHLKGVYSYDDIRWARAIHLIFDKQST